MNALTKVEGGALALSEPELLEVLGSSLYPGAKQSSIRLVISYCRAAGFDVMQKPVHIVPMWNPKAKEMQDVVMPGVGLYRTQAARTGHAGSSEPEFGPDVTETIGGAQITYPSWCRVTVRRRQQNGEVDEFTAREFWKENYAVKGGQEKSIAPNAMWTKRPYGQLAKCAEAQALRKAFPEIGSQPAAEEMEGRAIEGGGEVIDAATGEIVSVAKAEPAVWPADAFATQFTRWEKAVQGRLKTVDDILALAKSKGALAPEQEKQIRAIKAAEPEKQAEAVDPFVEAMDAAEAAAGSGK